MDYSQETSWQLNRSFEETNWCMLQEEKLCDVTFLVGSGKKEKIRAHRFILASRSPVFFTMFCGSLPETSEEVEVPDIEPTIFHDLLRFIYKEDCQVCEENVMALLYCSKKYELPRLKEACYAFLNTNITCDNVCTILQHSIQFEEGDLENRCMEFVMENAEMVLKSDSLSSISQQLLRKIVESDELGTDELFVYNACKSWATAQYRSKTGRNKPSGLELRNQLGDIIYHIRFGTMSFKKFTENVTIEDILTSEEKVFVFQSMAGITCSNGSIPFKSLSRQRQHKKENVEIQRFGQFNDESWPYGKEPECFEL